MVDRYRRQFTSARQRNFVEQLQGQRGISTEIEKVVVGANRRELKHALPDGSQHLDHRGCGHRVHASTSIPETVSREIVIRAIAGSPRSFAFSECPAITNVRMPNRVLVLC